MSQECPRFHTTDQRTVLLATLYQEDTSGILTAVNLTGKTVKFKMLNKATGESVVALTSTGVTVVTAASGIVSYDWSDGGLGEAGVFNGFFVVTESGETDHFPVKQDALQIIVDSDTETGEEAYEAALEEA